VIELYKSNKLFDKGQYKAVRAAFARLFEQRHDGLIRRAYGTDYEALTAWLNARPEIKQNFYTALDEQYDRLDNALALFRDIWKLSPAQAEKYADLAIATAVTWDDERGVYDYGHHQRRTKSVMPGQTADGLANFRYLVQNEKALAAPVRRLPWEFLVFVVDHRTPLDERQWAQAYYKTNAGRRSWHQDVPYDHDMLGAERGQGSTGLRPRLQGKDYTLPNIKKYGGVCAMQADFAARVAKSVGVPAVYCSGKSAHRGWHAWWMYVHLDRVGGRRIRFRLVSDGRFEGEDLFYTGQVTDPQTGRRMLDRDLERRLAVVAADPAGKRQAELIMRAYPWLCRRLRLGARERVAYLDSCLKVSPYNEAAWLECVRLVKANELQADQKRTVLGHLPLLYDKFANYPDFLSRVLDGLLLVEPSPRERIRFYDRAVALFERTGRADLACAARLKVTELWCEQGEWQTAANGLIRTIRKFPKEGRYLPDLTKKLQEVARNYKGGSTRLADLYLELVPALIAHYPQEGSEYATTMYKQAMAYLEDNQLNKHATTLEAQAKRARPCRPRPAAPRP
jgi:hypothetical protein